MLNQYWIVEFIEYLDCFCSYLIELVRYYFDIKEIM